MVELQNDSTRLLIYPEFGGRIDSVLDRHTNKDWAWHPGSYDKPSYRNDGSFDEHFEGGWEEVFPSDAAGSIGPNTYYDHGELWRQAWSVEHESAESLLLSCSCSGVPVDVQKRISLTPNGFELRYEFTNRSDHEIPFLFKLHPAVAIEEGDRIELQADAVEPVDLGFSTIAGESGATPYPFVKGNGGELERIDVMRVPDDATREFVYISKLVSPEIRVRSVRTGSVLSLNIDRDEIPFVWLLTSFGGWKNAAGDGMYLALVEPATTKPWDLSKALSERTCAVLRPRETKVYVFSFDFPRSVPASRFATPAKAIETI